MGGEEMNKERTDVKQIVDKIVDDTRPVVIRNKIPLQIVGDSPFTRAVMKRCMEWNVPAVFNNSVEPNAPAVVDSEQYDLDHMCPVWQNIDDHCIFNDFSACSDAVSMILDAFHVGRKEHVAIIGNGHAVKGLAQHLLNRGCSVCIMNSKTKNISTMTIGADVVIAATPKLDDMVFTNGKLIIDVGDVLQNRANMATNYVSASDVGKITCAVLAFRASIWKGF